MRVRKVVVIYDQQFARIPQLLPLPRLPRDKDDAASVIQPPQSKAENTSVQSDWDNRQAPWILINIYPSPENFDVVTRARGVGQPKIQCF